MIDYCNCVFAELPAYSHPSSIGFECQRSSSPSAWKIWPHIGCFEKQTLLASSGSVYPFQTLCDCIQGTSQPRASIHHLQVCCTDINTFCHRLHYADKSKLEVPRTRTEFETCYQRLKKWAIACPMKSSVVSSKVGKDTKDCLCSNCLTS